MAVCSSSSSSGLSSNFKTFLVHITLAGAAVTAAFGAHAYLHMRRSGKKRNRTVGIIPVCFDSSRSQGKPLVEILGKPMIQITWERAKLAKTLDQVVVATDDEEIKKCCEAFGAVVIMTSKPCQNGTECCNEALKKLEEYDIVVNIPGDEPLIEPNTIDGVVKALQAATDAVFSTAVTSIKPEDASDPNRVKCVVDTRGYAVYFSRGLIPHNKSGKVKQEFPYLQHLNIACYDTKFLRTYPNLAPTPLQLEEDLEELKILENGYKIKVIRVDQEAHAVDSPEDVAKIETLMREKYLH